MPFKRTLTQECARREEGLLGLIKVVDSAKNDSLTGPNSETRSLLGSSMVFSS